MIIPIEKKRRKKHKGFCANIECRARLEPPYNLFEFSLDCVPGHVFNRTFCVECIGKILESPEGGINFRVVEHETG